MMKSIMNSSATILGGREDAPRRVAVTVVRVCHGSVRFRREPHGPTQPQPLVLPQFGQE